MTDRQQKRTPVWVMGLGNGVFGLVGGFLVLTLPQMLAAQGVSMARIAAVSGVCFSPGFWVFLLGPVLDVRFSRRWWATAFALLAGVAMGTAVWLHANLLALEAALIVSYSAATMCSNALGGWLASLTPQDDEGGLFEARVSAWTQVATFLGNGLMAILSGELLRNAPVPVAAVLLGALVASPAVLFLFIPRPAHERRIPWRDAGTVFGEFGAQLRVLLRVPAIWLTLALFVLPTGAFALTNQLGGVASDFHAPDAFVSRLGGVILSVAGALAALLVPVLARLVRPVSLYLGIGIAGCLFTLLLLVLPRTKGVFAFAFMGENVFQAMSFTAAVAIVLAAVGRENPLAGTLFGLLTAASVLPIVAMGYFDGRAYEYAGLRGMFAFDGALSLVACAVMSSVMVARRAAMKRINH